MGDTYCCACAKVPVKTDTQEVTTIQSTHARPLSVRRKDRALKKPADKRYLLLALAQVSNSALDTMPSPSVSA
jgi:Protein of unknown function (DUF4087)